MIAIEHLIRYAADVEPDAVTVADIAALDAAVKAAIEQVAASRLAKPEVVYVESRIAS